MADPLDQIPGKADPAAEAPPGGEGVPREPVTIPAEIPATEQTLESLQEQVRILQQAYQKSEGPIPSILGNSPLWGDNPQLAHQLQQPGQFRPGRFETRVFNMSEANDRAEHDRILTEAQSEKASYVITRERQWCPDDKSWRVLVELQHFEFLQTLTYTKPKTS